MYYYRFAYKSYFPKVTDIFVNRSIPSVVDGLKPSMRKILYGAFKRNLVKEIKVAQLAGYISEVTSYHHGEASLQRTIIKMAQDYVGSNNLNILEPIGQFGTRLMGGDDCASPRYIFTKLSPFSRLLFPKDDDTLLEYMEEDGQSIEPHYYCPIIPLLLINGSQGIGSGWSSFVPPHCPFEVMNCLRAKLDFHDNISDNLSQAENLKPKFRGFKGEILKKLDGTGFITRGIVEQVGRNTLEVTELPIGKWIVDYKTFLLNEQIKGTISSFTENHSTTDVSFQIKMSPANFNRLKKKGFIEFLKLESSLPITNMHAFDHNYSMTKYQTAGDIIDSFFPIRLELYKKRKELMINNLNHTSAVLKNKARFIEAVSLGQVDLVRGPAKTKEDIVTILSENQFDKQSKLNLLKASSCDDGADSDEFSPINQYDYLLNMPLSSFNSDRINSLKDDAEKAEKELKDLRSISPSNLWREDLNKLETALAATH